MYQDDIRASLRNQRPLVVRLQSQTLPLLTKLLLIHLYQSSFDHQLEQQFDLEAHLTSKFVVFQQGPTPMAHQHVLMM